MDKLESLTVAQLKKLVVSYNLHNVIKPYSKMRKHELIAALRHHNTFLNNVMTNKEVSINVPQKVIKVKAPPKKRVKKNAVPKIEEDVEDVKEAEDVEEVKEAEEVKEVEKEKDNVRHVPPFEIRKMYDSIPTDKQIKNFDWRDLSNFLNNNSISRKNPIYRFETFLDYNSSGIKQYLKELKENNFEENESYQILKQFYSDAYYSVIPKRLARLTKTLIKIKKEHPNLNVPFVDSDSRLSYENDF
jgi:hypothetical protein